MEQANPAARTWFDALNWRNSQVFRCVLKRTTNHLQSGARGISDFTGSVGNPLVASIAFTLAISALFKVPQSASRVGKSSHAFARFDFSKSAGRASPLST